MKKRLMIPILLILMILLNGCQLQQPKKDSYTLKEIYKTKAYGFFVKDGDTFYPVKNIRSGETEGFQWCVGNPGCPKVTDKTPLVAVFELNGDMPENYFLDSYKSLGYSIGANVSIGEDEKSMWIDTAHMCSGSHIYKSFLDENVDAQIELVSINDVQPFSNIDTDVNILTGLQKNKYYDLNVYIGTQNMTASICADTMVFKLTGQTTLDRPFNKTPNQYFEVNLPENISPGYYDINGEGLFQVP